VTIREQVIQNVLRDPSALRAVPPRGILHRAIRTDVVSVLPQAPVVGDEVYLTVDASTRAVANMLYLATGWVQVGAPPVVTALTTTGVADGVEVYYLADSDNGIVWHFRYRAAGSESYPWEFVGGSSLRSEIATSQTTTNPAYVDLTTAGPSVTTPLAGDYILHFGSDLNNSGANYSIAAVKIGAAATVDADAVLAFSGSASGVEVSVSRTMVKTALAASTELKVQYKAGAGTLAAGKRFLYVTPARVGA